MAPIRGAVRPQASYSRSAGVTAPSTTRSNPSSATATQQSAATHRPVPVVHLGSASAEVRFKNLVFA